ncbi:MAG: histone deacetylase [Candidatus Zixiibacteriota bacterium]
MKVRTGFIYHQDYLKHNTGERHPENSRRLVHLLEHLRDTEIWKELELIKPHNPSPKWIKLVHSSDYIKSIEEACKNGVEMLDADTIISSDSYNVALLAVGGVLAGVDAVIKKRVENVFCAVRPPGHHAEHERAMGFCIFNNVAVATRYVQKKHDLKKVLIVDWDAHHGNGTQNAFYQDPSVYYFSVHQFPHYPGTGREDEIGEKEGTGFTLNMPMAAGSGDVEYLEAFENILYPAAKQFSPDFVLISAGFDGHKDDPLSNLNLTAEGYKNLTQIIMDLSKECCQGKVVSVLEGGYNLKVFSESVEAHLTALTGME